MANCPKCGKKLRLYHISQFCPACKVNMRFYHFEENFIREAKTAELSQAVVHGKIRRLKAAFVGSRLAVARLAVMLLPLAALLVPFLSAVLSLPFRQTALSVSALGLYSAFSGGDFQYLLSMKGSALFGAQFSALLTAQAAYAVTAVFAVLVLLSCVLCFLSYRNMQKLTCVFASLGILASVVTRVLCGNFEKVSASCGLLNGKGSVGWIAVPIAFAAVLLVNALLVKKGIPVVYDEGMEERVAVYRKVKAGVLSIDELPQPVVETEATRKIQEEIEREEASYATEKNHREAVQ